jgi:hypothetical protein
MESRCLQELVTWPPLRTRDSTGKRTGESRPDRGISLRPAVKVTELSAGKSARASSGATKL